LSNIELEEQEYNKEIICPYCKEEYTDSWEYNNMDSKTISCLNCGKEFLLIVEIEVTYSTYPI